jgi:hypothetical protein
VVKVLGHVKPEAAWKPWAGWHAPCQLLEALGLHHPQPEPAARLQRGEQEKRHAALSMETKQTTQNQSAR